MNRNRGLHLVVGSALAILLCGMDSAYAGRGDKSGTAAAPELLIPVGARSIAFGGASLATAAGAEAIYWNPAGLARLEGGTDVMFSHMSYLADIGVEYGALCTRLGSTGFLGLSIKSLSVGEIPITTEDQPDGTGGTASPTFLIIGGTFSRQVSDRIYVGITSNLIFEKMDKVSATGVAFNGGVQYLGLGGVEGLSLGVAVKNVGPRMKYDGSGLLRSAEVGDASRGSSPLKIEASSSDLPSTIEIGMAYSTQVGGTGRLTVLSAFQNNNYSDDEYRFGGEYVYDNLLFLRAGMAVSPQADGSDYIYGPSGGIGIHSMVQGASVSVDYAFRWVRYFSGNHVIGLNVGF
jgi:hypothetical protein